MQPDSIAVIGLGAIGGSIAWQARLAGVPTVVGYSPEPAEGVQALKAGALSDIADSPARAIRGAALAILAAPPASTLELIGQLGSHLAVQAVLTDVASIKSPILARARAAGLGARFAGGHPFAGTEGSGWAAARPDRFRDAIIYVCSTGAPGGDEAARQVMSFWQEIMQAQPVLIDAEIHDRQLAWTSHLPQAVASALARALANRRLSGASFGSGAQDTTRLARSSPDLWVDVFLHNADPIEEALREAEGELARLRALIAARDARGIRAFLDEARAFRQRLEPGHNR